MTKEIMQRVLGVVVLLACLLGGIALLLSNSQKDTQAKRLAKMPPTSAAPLVAETKQAPAPAVVVLREVKDSPHQRFELNAQAVSAAPAAVKPAAKTVTEPVVRIAQPVITQKPKPIVIQSPVVKKWSAKKKRPAKVKRVARAKKHAAPAAWLVQIASFTQRQSAEQLLRQVPKRLGVFHIQKASVGHGVRYRVTLGPFTDRKRAMQARTLLGQQYSTQAIVVRGG